MRDVCERLDNLVQVEACRLNIVFIAYLKGFGGAENMIIRVANAMALRNHEVTLISLVSHKMCYPIAPQIHHIQVADKGNNKLSLIYNRYLLIKAFLSGIRPDLVVNFWLQPAYLTAFYSSRLGFRDIYSERGDPGDKEYSGILSILRRMTFSKLDGFVFQSHAARRYFNDIPLENVCVIPNPVSIDQTLRRDPNKIQKTIVNIGRLCPQKNQSLLIEAFKLVVDKFPDYTLEIYGTGELGESLQNKIDSLGLKGKVRLAGVYSNIHARIVNASVFVLSSDYEGMPNALMEAMALGIPCVTTDYAPGGVREFINNGVNGLIVEKNNVQALADGIKLLLNDYDQALEYGSKAKNILNTHSVDFIMDKWEECFRSVAKKI